MLYRPKSIDELRTPVKLLIPTTTMYNGVRRPTYSTTGDVIFVNWKSRQGTETTINGVYSILDTAEVTTWYRPDIKSDCRLMLEDGRVYRIITDPENIDMANRILMFKVERVKGGV